MKANGIRWLAFLGLAWASTAPRIWGDLVISAVQCAGVTADDEFVEFHNTSAETIPVAGFRLGYQSSGGSTSEKFVFPNVTIPAKGYYLLVGAQYTGPVSADAKRSLSLSGTSAGFALYLVDTEGKTRHRAAFGSSSNLTGNGTAMSNVAAGRAAVRKANGRSTAETLSTGGRDSFFSRGYAAGNDLESFAEVSNFQPRHLGDIAHGGGPPTPVAEIFETSPGKTVVFTIPGVLPQSIKEMGLLWEGVLEPQTNGWTWLSNSGISFACPVSWPKSRPVRWRQPLASGESVTVDLGAVNVVDWRYLGLPSEPLAPGQSFAVAVSNGGCLKEAYQYEVGGMSMGFPLEVSDTRMVLSLPPAISPGDPIRVWNAYTLVTNSFMVPALANGPPLFTSNSLVADRTLLGKGGLVRVTYRRLDPEGDLPAPGFPRLVWDGLPTPVPLSREGETTYVVTTRPSFPTNGTWAPVVEDRSLTGDTRVVDSRLLSSHLEIRVDVEPPPRPTWVRRDSTTSPLQCSWPRECGDGAWMVLRWTESQGLQETRWPYGNGSGTWTPSYSSNVPTFSFCIQDDAGNEGAPFLLPGEEGLSPWETLRTRGIWNVRRGHPGEFPAIPGIRRIEAYDLRGRYLGRVFPSGEDLPAGPCVFRMITNGGAPAHQAAEILP